MPKKLLSPDELFATLGLTKRSRKGKAFKCPPGPLSEADAAEWDRLTILGKRRSRTVDNRQTLREMQELAHLPDCHPLLDPWNYDPLLLPGASMSTTASSTFAKMISPKEKVERTEAKPVAKIRPRRNIKFGK